MKYRILSALREAAPGFVSGGTLSRLLNVSRTAIWKYINELRNENYEIEASTRNGYRLLAKPGRLNGFEAAYNLGTAVVGHSVLYYDVLDSTNNHAKELAANGCEDGTTVIAGMQTAGRGRTGKKWESPQDSGIYLSVVLRPEIPPEKIQLLTLASSIAIVDALKSTCGIDAGIKWPNDVILGGKKVCGILTEMNCETDIVNYAVLGIGINYSQTSGDFPGDLKDKAISLQTYMQENAVPGMVPGRLDIVRAVLVELDRCYSLVSAGFGSRIVEMWKERSLTLGRKVLITGRDAHFTGTALDITGDGRLVVSCSDGVTREVLSGEISVRGILGYV